MTFSNVDSFRKKSLKKCVQNIDVNPVGKKLLTFVSGIMKNDEINSIFLITGGERAVKFYKSNGFVKSKDGVMMEYDL